MRRAIGSALIVLAVISLAAVATSGGGSSRPHRARPAVLVASPGPDRSLQLETAQAVADYAHALDVQRVGEYLHAIAVAQVGAYLASIPPPPPPPAPVPTVAVEPVVPLPAPAAVASGARSYAWWEALATCESGNTNAWRTGYYGLEAGSPVGGMSKGDQLAWAERIYAQYGDGAWGCSPVAWRNVPGG